MMKQIFTGELTSYASDQNVVEQIWEGVPATLSLCIGAAVLWMSLAIVFGYLSAVHAGKFTDRALTILVAGGDFDAGLLAGRDPALLPQFKVQLFPTGSYVPLTEDPAQWAYHLILPWFTLAVLFIGFYSRVLRSNMLDAMNEDYVRTARAKGISERQVRIRHVLRNSMIPIITLFGLDFGMVVGGGAILTETVYNINGVGLYAGEAIGSLDLPPLMAVTMFGAFFIVLFNTIVDILYALPGSAHPARRGGADMSASDPLGRRSPGQLRHRRRCRAGGRRRFVRTRRGRDPGHRRRVRLRQKRYRADTHGPHPRAQRQDHRLGQLSRPRAQRARRRPAARRPRRSRSR